jgi:alpha-L-fucosidase 2
MRHTLSLLALTLCGAALAQNSPDRSAHVLWYPQPATDWEKEALPIGNGRIGAMVFGGTDSERVQFAEKSLWTGGPGSEGGYDYGLPKESQAALVQSIGKKLAEGATLAPEEVARQLGRKMHNYGDYQSFGDLLIEREGAEAPVSNYRRELDLKDAVARVSYTQGGARIEREYFVSYPDQVLVVQLSSSKVQKLRVRLAIPDNRSVETRTDKTRIRVTGALKSNGLKYATILRVVTECGRVTPDEFSLRVESECPITIVLAARTNYRMRYPDYRAPGDPADAAAADVLKAAEARHDSLLERHQADYRALYDRVNLDLGAGANTMPTDRLRASYGSGNAAQDRALETLYFNYGRYLLIASSRAGSLPANLQGVWNDKATPPWNADYHVNINLQMNYWPAESANLAETAIPYFDFVDHLVTPGQLAAQRYFGAKGWTMFLNTNAWGYVGPIDWPTAFWQPEASAWLAVQYYEHYLFSQDTQFLRQRAWPVLKGASDFWMDALIRDPRTGRLVVSPSYSPEHGPFTAGASMSQQIVAELFICAAQAAEILGDKEYAERVGKAAGLLDPGVRIGKWGQLKEWNADLDDAKDDHRHVSHLFALHPGNTLFPDAVPQFANAVRVTLDARGDASTGWSRAWKINFWARLNDGDRAHKLLAGLLSDSTLPNLWDTHPPFQIDGNFGATAGMVEMLVRSYPMTLQVLPALPKAWKRGRVSGIRARGDITLSIEWDECGPSEIGFVAGHDQLLAVRSTMFGREFQMRVNDVSQAPPMPPNKDNLQTLQVTAGAHYGFRRPGDATCMH